MTRLSPQPSPGTPSGATYIQASCLVCGSRDLASTDVLSEDLIRTWELSADEARTINRQQGRHCIRCRSTLRCMALARAILRHYDFAGTFVDFVQSETARGLRVLEINEAGGLSASLATLPRHRLASHPEVDMEALPYGGASFDLVVHSDTLEHIADPTAGLRECRRVLADGGACAFTIPFLAGRLTRSRRGLPPSYHGTAADGAGYLVHTEFGADAWRVVIEAGFAECTIVAVEAPVAHALLGVR